ncbi:MAG: outer membrane beta-barrel protein [Desulfovibrio sp.]|jgi:opacity protein-like surface antigen|nr:outer membrane beta-barrel protein [Desulfovibrio sp.]
MKKLFAALCLLCALSLPDFAKAEVNGVYVTPKFLMSIMSTGNNSSDISAGGFSIFDTSTSYSQFTLGGGLAVGYDFFPQSQLPLRAELEVLFRGNQKNTSGMDATDVGRTAFGMIGMDPDGFEMKGTWNTTTLFANVYYDFHNSTDFTPYIGAGAGLAFNYAGYTASYQGQDFASGDKYSTTFAWNVGAGCSYAFNENFALDVAYRYVSTGASSVDGDVQGVHYQIDSNPNGHEFTIGLRMTF